MDGPILTNWEQAWVTYSVVDDDDDDEDNCDN